MKRAVIIGAIGLVLAACGSASDAGTSSGPSDTLLDVAAQTQPASEWEQKCPGLDEEVVFYVEGTARTVSITIGTGGSTSQASHRSVPLRSKAGVEGLFVGCLSPDEFTYLSAQNEGALGTVTCRIERDGSTVSESTSEGEYVIASCDD